MRSHWTVQYTSNEDKETGLHEDNLQNGTAVQFCPVFYLFSWCYCPVDPVSFFFLIFLLILFVSSSLLTHTQTAVLLVDLLCYTY